MRSMNVHKICTSTILNTYVHTFLRHAGWRKMICGYFPTPPAESRCLSQISTLFDTTTNSRLQEALLTL